jgi:hypothetical protein
MAILTTTQLIELIDAVLANRGGADFYEAYGEAGNTFRGMKVSELFEERRKLTQQLAAETGAGIGAPRFSLAEIIDQ